MWYCTTQEHPKVQCSYLFLLALCNTDFQCISAHVTSISSSVGGCISEGREEEHRSLVESFMRRRNAYKLNVSKIKELIVYFRRIGEPLTALIIQGETVEMVQCHKYLAVHTPATDRTGATAQMDSTGRGRVNCSS